MLPEAEALLEGPGSDEERMRESRSRLVTIRQQVKSFPLPLRVCCT